MASQKELKEYLVGQNGYLKNSDNDNKVIMLSGKWGSGKTHFWQNIIEEELKNDLKDKSYSYVSLYGKSTIEEIENDIFSQIFFHSIGGKNLVTKTTSTFTKYTKRYGKLASSFFDFSELATALEEESKDNKKRIALERLNNGGIICIDDFERKSKDIDLNDLFGFITQLSLNFKCKIVIILNDDAFKGKEKDIFSNVKEKTVSKYLYYNPSIKELFDSIYKKHPIKKDFENSKTYIYEFFEEIEILNARIYVQVLDNLLEWLTKYPNSSSEIRRCVILSNCLFILYHTTFYIKDEKYLIKNWQDKIDYSDDYDSVTIRQVDSYFKPIGDIVFFENFSKYYKNLEDRTIGSQKYIHYKDFLHENINYYKSKFIANNLKIARNVDKEIFEKINNFIETGILIKENN